MLHVQEDGLAVQPLALPTFSAARGLAKGGQDAQLAASHRRRNIRQRDRQEPREQKRPRRATRPNRETGRFWRCLSSVVWRVGYQSVAQTMVRLVMASSSLGS